MKRVSYTIAAIGVAGSLITSRASSAEAANNLLDHLLFDTKLDYFMCSTVLKTAETISDTPGYGPSSLKTKEAYERFYEYRDKAAKNTEDRFAAIKRVLASKGSAEAALKELYIYWRAEMAPCMSHKTFDVVTGKFQSLVERVRVEASW